MRIKQMPMSCIGARSALAFASVALLLGISARHVAAQDTASANVVIDTSVTYQLIPPDFMGLSFETLALLPDSSGNYYFNPQDSALLQVFRTLDIKRLRIGGYSADDAGIPIPSLADIDNLFAFAVAVNAMVMYTVRLKDVRDPAGDVRIAQHIVQSYGGVLLCLEIGNEPNVYVNRYASFQQDWSVIYHAIIAGAPSAQFCGPSTTPGKAAAWAVNLAKAFGPSKHLKIVTQHLYPGGNGARVLDAASGIDYLLSPNITNVYKDVYEVIAPVKTTYELPYMLGETNSLSAGGARGVSNTAASAMWGLDYMYWWAEHGASGLNFHTGHLPIAPSANSYSGYSMVTRVSQGVAVHPLGYAVKAFDLGSHGRLVKTVVRSASGVNLTAYATVATDSSLYVTIINKEHGPFRRAAKLTIDAGARHVRAAAMFLVAPGNNAAWTGSMSLGGSSFETDGTWRGEWSSLPLSSVTGSVEVTLPPVSAVVIRLSRSM